MPTWAQDSFILEGSGPASVPKQNKSMLRVKTDHFLKGCRGSSVMPTWAQDSFILEASGPASVLKQNESIASKLTTF